MSKGLWKASMIGRLGSDPEITVSSGGVKVAKFSLAIDRKYKDQEETEWGKVTCFNKLADIAQQYLHKGDRVSIYGDQHCRKFTGKDGVQKLDVDLTGSDIVLLESKKPAPTPAPPTPTGPEISDEDIPF
jgi:single-strand DNA-binding protein